MAETVHVDDALKHHEVQLEKEQEQVFEVEDADAPTKEEMKAVRRRIDLYLVPVMMITYSIQYYGKCSHRPLRSTPLTQNSDKSVLNQAALFGILTDLGLEKVSEVGGKKVVDTTRFSYG
jgi:hypothetical protein